MRIIDLRSDTVTKPTAAMRAAMAAAEVGDDVYGEDPTVNRLEALAALKMGKEAALFVPSGSMGNSIALMTHCERGQEAICDSEAHILHYEMGAAAVVAGVQLHTLDKLHTVEGVAKLSGHIREEKSYLLRTRLICLENTLNRGGGSVMAAEQMAAVSRIGRERGLAVHLDGARIFNAALALQCDVQELAGHADSVMFCLSKGLGAPVGSLLTGSRKFIESARRNRKLLGGGMRQAGVLAAAGLVALADTTHLADDHRKAKLLAAGLGRLPGLSVDPAGVLTNMVLADVSRTFAAALDFTAKIAKAGVLAGAISHSMVRFVTHRDVSVEDIGEALARMESILKE